MSNRKDLENKSYRVGWIIWFILKNGSITKKDYMYEFDIIEKTVFRDIKEARDILEDFYGKTIRYDVLKRKYILEELENKS
ncbi:hypothetical protein [Leuconostoc citreum]|uniref:hypothetical protein n=1 Tax=Leuconostoc citreum TaxID=33964 RepID=UPI001C1F74F2|nr:hypothetical protein [Leuconostoc citreum]MBU7450680.1 hypothetical protein [Leuconostoc citreum]